MLSVLVHLRICTSKIPNTSPFVADYVRRYIFQETIIMPADVVDS